MNLLPKWWKTNFLHVEFGIGLFLGAVFVVWFEKLNGAHLVDETLQGNRSAVYGALASIFGALLGFAITAVSVVLGFSSTERLSVIRESQHYSTLWKVFTAAIRTLGLATVATLVALVLDRDASPMRIVLHLSVFASILAIFRLARCVWVLENVIALVSAPSKARPGDQA
jgi:hypothetical protein